MLLESLKSVVRNFRGISRIVNVEALSHIQTQKYGRWASRRPSKIVNEDELFDVNVESSKPMPKSRKAQTISKQAKDETVKKKSEQFLNTKLYENEKAVSSIILSVKSNQHRKKNEQILIEGKRFIEDAIQAGVKPEHIIFSRINDIENLPISRQHTKLYKVPYKSIQLWSTLSTSPGIIGIFKKPKPKDISSDSLPITIICDNIRDPGNMGAILRTAAGVGCEKILLTKGCVNFWDCKVLRSAAGAHFRIPIYGSQEWSDIRSVICESARLYVADNRVDYDIDQSDSDIIGEDILTEYENLSNESAEETEVTKKVDKLKQILSLTVVPYYAVNYTENEVVLIIGGETKGLSNECFALVKEKNGIRVNIPLTNGVDSLNSGIALGVIAFEIKKQFLSIKENIYKLKQ